MGLLRSSESSLRSDKDMILIKFEVRQKINCSRQAYFNVVIRRGFISTTPRQNTFYDTAVNAEINLPNKYFCASCKWSQLIITLLINP